MEQDVHKREQILGKGGDEKKVRELKHHQAGLKLVQEFATILLFFYDSIIFQKHVCQRRLAVHCDR
jgi:hypothetical protein